MGRGLTTYIGSENVYSVVIMGRRYVVKRIRKKLKDGTVKTYYYVYEQYRDGDRVPTKYIAPLEEIVEFYIKHKRKHEERWARGDSNPRPPGYEPGALPG